MDKIIVYLNDPAYAQRQLAPMKSGDATPAGGAATTHWVLVACAPRMTRHISKWVSHSARENWRTKWAEKVFESIVPKLEAAGDTTTTLLAKGPLPELTKKLFAQHGACRVLDARRPKFGQEMHPITLDQPAGKDGGWEVPGAVVGLGALLVLAAE
ncbi:MAG: hypothetical protein H0X13_19735 [Ramlibacter sp.]|nr:hypothetical protein [Ramlibacter sp.]